MPGVPGRSTYPSPGHSCLVPAELATVVRRFSQTGIQDFLTLTLTEQTGLLYVGAREALFAFSVEALELQGVVRGGGAGGTWGREAGPGGFAWTGCPLSLATPTPFSLVSMSLRPRVCSTRWDRCAGVAGALVLSGISPESGDTVFSLGVPMLLPRAALMTHAWCVPAAMLTRSLPILRSHGRRQLRRRLSVSRKGRVTRSALWDLLGAGGCMGHALSPPSRCWSGSQGPCVPDTQTLTDASLSPDGVFQLHPLPTAI